MKGISKSIIAVIIVIIVVIAILGAYLVLTSHKPSLSVSTTTTTSPAVTSSVTLTVVTFSGESAQFIQYAGELFSQEHPGVTVKVITYPFSNYIDQELSALESHSSEYDIIGFTSTSAQRVAPYLLPLNTSLFNMTDLIGPQEAFGGIIYNSTLGRNITIGIVYETAVYLMAYKPSIFQNATLANEFYQEYHISFDPSTWQNWTDVLDADQFLVSHNITKYGFLIDDHVAHGIIDAYPAVFGWYYARNSTLNHGLVGGIPGFNIMFEGYIPSGFSFPLPSFNSTSGLEALEVYKSLISYEPSPSSIQISYDNLAQFYPDAAGAFLFTSQLSSFNSSQLQDTYLAPLPGGYAETGTDFLGISKYSTHVQLAEEFLAFLVSPKVQMIAFLKFGKFPASKEAFLSLISNTSLPNYQREWLSAVYNASLNAWANPPNIPPTYVSLISDFNSQVYNYLTGQTSAQQALQTAASDWLQAEVSYYG